ncbi:hypothetical protein SV7mr_49280 [Stieleria bergensis]|uniref:Ribbon-helix-helix protein CopG domain-containing protein n=1 Tax=Stieleria bergensis TaxID=2528025 RepID=A0A517T1X7_9BACT|nr:hypothetical protein SV7mr_49280 [Planctomycetes bacterium SV_7m_r]
MSGTQRKITVLLTDDEFDRFDGFCRENGFKKSTLLVRLMKEFLEKQNGLDFSTNKTQRNSNSVVDNNE